LSIEKRGRFGTTANGILEGPGTQVYSVGLFKNFMIKERTRFELNVNTTNAFNHPNFRNPTPTSRRQPPWAGSPRCRAWTPVGLAAFTWVVGSSSERQASEARSLLAAVGQADSRLIACPDEAQQAPGCPQAYLRHIIDRSQPRGSRCTLRAHPAD